MRLYGLIGYPLSHSFSPEYFKKKFQKENITGCDYKAFELPDIKQLHDLIKSNRDLRGFNVTIPYKEAVIPFLNEIDEGAEKEGAVNTVRVYRSCFSHDYRLKGYNTDIFGFEESIKLYLHENKKALVLGTGGASKAVVYVLRKNNISLLQVSRNPQRDEINYADIDETIMRKHLLIINTTPLGMHPDIKEAPAIPYDSITSSHLLYDLIYNPPETLFLKRGRAQGATVMNGYEMLKLQADKAWQIWNESPSQALPR